MSSATERVNVEMDSTENIFMMDDLSLLYTAIYLQPDMAELINIMLPYISSSKKADALYFAAMGMKKELLALVPDCPVDCLKTI